MPKKIDMVYLWVDGSDPKWKREKDKWLVKFGHKLPNSAQATTDARWRDNDELLYALRSLEQNAPWINHIYIVTGFGQVPKWLDTKHPKITMVPHEKIFPKGALPTFNSEAIEHSVLNIPGLSEYFLYGNDDMMIGQPVAPDYFFDDMGRALVRTNKKMFYKKSAGTASNLYRHIVLSATLKIKQIFGKDYTNLRPPHNIEPCLKSVIISAQKHPELHAQIKQTINNKFRNDNDLSHWIYALYGFATGKYIPAYYRGMRPFMFWRKSTPNTPILARNAKQNKYIDSAKLFCINDTQKSTNSDRRDNAEWLSKKFPKKSSFEK